MSKPEIVKWLKEMGYDGDIPENLDSVCTPATNFIWKQVIQNTLNKNDVVKIRNNLIIKRLQNEMLNKQNEYSFSIPEIDAYIKKQDVERNVAILTSEIQDKEHKLDALSRENKLKYVTIESINAEAKENMEKAYLLESRVAQLENNISETEENLSIVPSITPTEVDDNIHANDITELLKKCSSKLQKHLLEIPLEDKSAPLPISKPSHESISFKSELKLSEHKVTILKRNVSEDKTVQLLNTNDKTPKKVNKALFRETENICVLKEIPENVVRGKRESLGILPDGFLNFSDEIHDDRSPLSVIMDQSQVSKQFFDNSHFVGKEKAAKNGSVLKNILNNHEVADELKKGLRKYDRRLLWSIFSNLNDNLIIELQKCVLSCNDIERNTKNNRIDMAKLYFIHVQIGKHTDQLKKSIMDVSAYISRERSRINEQLKGLSLHKISELNKLLDLEIENVSLDAMLSTMKQELNNSKNIVYSSVLQSIGKISDLNNLFNIEPEEIGLDFKSSQNKNNLGKQNEEYNNELLCINNKICSVNDQIMIKLNGIQDFLTHINKTLNNLKRIRENTNTNLNKLSTFISDMFWAEPLSLSLISKEVKTFKEFPLAYNKQFKYLNNTGGFREISYQNIPSHIPLNSDVLYIVSNILDTPYSPPETILFNILKLKLKMQALKSINIENNFPKYTEYSQNDLNKLDSENEEALLSKLNHLFNYSRKIKMNSAYATMKQVNEIWTEMSLKKFISPNTLVDGRDYKYYEQKCINYLSN